MKKYQIVIREILSTVVTVKAESVEDAKDIAEDLYYNEDIILDAENLESREMKEMNETEYKEF